MTTITTAPVPPRTRYPLESLRVGECFTLEAGQSANGLRVSACRYGKRHRRRYTVRTVKTPGGPLIRCWRLA